MKGWTQVCNDSYYLGYEDGYKKGYADAVKELNIYIVTDTDFFEPRLDESDILKIVEELEKSQGRRNK